MFNTLKYAKILEEVGFTREQSEATVVMLSDVMEEKLATKDDFSRIEKKLELLEARLIIKMGAMQAASIAIIVALIKAL